VLLTNLANRVQPIIRYDLGDSVVAQPGRCLCGNPLPSILVRGRCDDVLTVAGPAGRLVRLLPMALTRIVEEAAGQHRFQIVQRAPDCLALRLDAREHRRHDGAFERAARALRDHLARQGAPSVQVVSCSEPPRRDRASGKLRQVVATR
jgi:phenylacetate-coenzyme A ligase PaaK-like adenylate-forming protein